MNNEKLINPQEEKPQNYLVPIIIISIFFLVIWLCIIIIAFPLGTTEYFHAFVPKYVIIVPIMLIFTWSLWFFKFHKVAFILALLQALPLIGLLCTFLFEIYLMLYSVISLDNFQIVI